jgi:hypothetical protein
LGGHWRGVPLPQQVNSEYLLPFAACLLSKTRFSAVADMKTKYHLMTNLENDLRAAISKLQTQYDDLYSKRQPQPSH